MSLVIALLRRRKNLQFVNLKMSRKEKFICRRKDVGFINPKQSHIGKFPFLIKHFQNI